MNHINQSSDNFSRRWRRKAQNLSHRGKNLRKSAGSAGKSERILDQSKNLLQNHCSWIAFSLQKRCFFYCSHTYNILNMNTINETWGILKKMRVGLI